MADDGFRWVSFDAQAMAELRKHPAMVALAECWGRAGVEMFDELPSGAIGCSQCGQTLDKWPFVHLEREIIALILGARFGDDSH